LLNYEGFSKKILREAMRTRRSGERKAAQICQFVREKGRF
jgi:hypothetical protein